MHKLIELELSNFRGWKHLHLVDLDKKGLCAINGINGGGKCLEKDSYLYNNNTLTKIVDVSENWNPSGFKEVFLRLTAENGRKVTTSHIFSEDVDKIIKLTTNNGFSVGGTEDHGILIIDKDCRFKFKSLSSIKDDDYICIDRSQNSFVDGYPNIEYVQDEPSICCSGLAFNPPKVFNEQMAAMLGYYIANGSYGKRKNRISISSSNTILINNMKVLSDYLGVEIKTDINYGNSSIGGVWFARFMKYLLDGNIKTARDKTVPSIVLKSPKSCQINFLRALIDCDGYYSKKGDTLEYYSSSENIAKVVHLMLLNFGIVSRLSFNESAKIGSKIYNHKYWTVAIRSNNIDIYFNKIGSLIYEKKEKTRNPNKDIIPFLKEILYEEIDRIKNLLNVDRNGQYKIGNRHKRFINTTMIKSGALSATYCKVKSFLDHIKNYDDVYSLFNKDLLKICRNIIDFNFYFDSIGSIEVPSGRKKVYDVTIPDGHCFFSNGFINHNSSIRQSIEYLLLDKIQDIEDIEELPHNINSECTIRGVITRDNGDRIEIIKHRNHKGASGNKTLLSVNDDTTLTHSDRRQTQKNIEELLDISDGSIYSSTIFSQNSPSFIESTEGDRKKVLYSFLGLDKYTEYMNKAKDECSDINLRIEDFQNKLDKVQVQILELDSNIEEFENRSKTYEDTRKSRIESLLITKEEIKEDNSLEELEHKLIILKNEFVDDKEIDIYLNKLNKEITELTRKKQEIVSNINQIDRELKNIGDGTCPVLKEVICNRLKDNEEETSNNLNDEKNRLLCNREEISFELDKQTEVKNSIIHKSNENRKIQSDINQLEKEIAEVKFYNSRIESQKKEIDRRIKSIREEDNPYFDLKNKAELRLNDIIADYKHYKTRIEELENELPYYKFWMEGFGRSGIPNMKIEGFLEELETRTNKYLSDMNSDMYVKIDAQAELKSGDIREKISYKVLSTNKDITDYHSYSGGQKQRIKIASLLAFADLLGKFDLIVMDEILELSLDDGGKISVVRLLREKAQDIGSILVISHDSSIKDSFDTAIHVCSNNGVSEIVE
uniref:DOD-type homing endonuclease domain-containing protein n=1 Tax=viral metagenome TaxID=1070528 RepID=A0A6H1ZAK1_9ZZZZ